MKTNTIIVAFMVAACYVALLSTAVSPQSIQHLRQIDSVETGTTAMKDAQIDQIISDVKNRQETRKAKLEKDFGITL